MRATSLVVILTLSFFNCSLCDTQLSGILEPYDLLFDNAVEAYYKQDWLSVILNMERALRNKGTVRKVRAHCRLSCANQTAFGDPVPDLGVPVPGVGPLEDLEFFHRVLKRAECVTACETEKLGPSSLHKVSDEVELEFKKRTPYNYLQVAYFKINKLDKAVAAANTFHVANPDHMEMRQNLEYYSMMAGVQAKDFKDLEAQPHMEEFLEGKRLYSVNDFSSAAEHFEAALDEYFSADEECRVLCEGAYDYNGHSYMEYNADLFQAFTDHYLHVLHCKQSCSVQLATSGGSDKPLDDFLPALINYLQFSFYNSEKHEKAIEFAKTYLLFYPADEVMEQNLAYYSAVLGEEKAVAVPARADVQQYISRSLLEKELLYFGYEFFGITFVDTDTWTPENIMPQKLRDKQKVDKETAARITEEIGNLMKEIETLVEEKTKDSTDIVKMVKDGGSASAADLGFDGMVVSMAAAALNGSQRVVLDGVITDHECQELQQLSNAAGQVGAEYRGSPNPHTASETIQAVTVLQALKLGQEGLLPVKSVRTFFDLSKKVRGAVESSFGLETSLYFSFSHLVCRSTIDEKHGDGQDASHPAQANNCLLISELNECIKDLSTYTDQDFTAILYLNEDFEGGDFIFTELDAKAVTAAVRPQCGRLVAFGAGKENPHSVSPVSRGQRCALVFRFTLDAQHNEKERIQAEELLRLLPNPVDLQNTEQDRGGDTPSEPTTQPERGEAATPTEVESAPPTGDQVGQTANQHVDGPADTNLDPTDIQKDKQSKAKATPKTKTKPASKDKAKPAVKTGTKTKKAGKVKAAEKKEKPETKKTVKVSKKTVDGAESTQRKSKTSKSDTNKNTHKHTHKNNEEL